LTQTVDLGLNLDTNGPASSPGPPLLVGKGTGA
jgi:hypothetical protein